MKHMIEEKTQKYLASQFGKVIIIAASPEFKLAAESNLAMSKFINP